MTSMTDDPLHPIDSTEPMRLRLGGDIDIATRLSSAVLISGTAAAALHLAIKIAAGPRDDRADDVAVVHAADSINLHAALTPLAGAAAGRRRAIVVHDVDALDRTQQSMFKAAMADNTRHGPNASRVIATTSVPLFEQVVQGSFDSVLFYRLNIVHIMLDTMGARDDMPRRIPPPVAWTRLARRPETTDRIPES
jgi:hypothetical protein